MGSPSSPARAMRGLRNGSQRLALTRGPCCTCWTRTSRLARMPWLRSPSRRLSRSAIVMSDRTQTSWPRSYAMPNWYTCRGVTIMRSPRLNWLRRWPHSSPNAEGAPPPALRSATTGSAAIRAGGRHASFRERVEGAVHLLGEGEDLRADVQGPCTLDLRLGGE